MSRKQLPSQSELEKRYAPFLKNTKIEKARNWSLPNSADGFKEEKNLEFMESQSEKFFDISVEVFRENENSEV